MNCNALIFKELLFRPSNNWLFYCKNYAASRNISQLINIFRNKVFVLEIQGFEVTATETKTGIYWPDLRLLFFVCSWLGAYG
jgi:hypothetical protein